MLGIDPELAQCHIDTYSHMVLVKQKLRRMRTEWLLKIKEEVTKQLKVGFIKPLHQVDWIANVIPVPKKDEKVRMCVDYRDLNRVNPKDNFSLPHIDTLVDNTTKNSIFSFMDEFLWYNQIRMASEDIKKTTFVMMWETTFYSV